MCFSDTSDIKLTETDFESGQDSAILVRERTRGSKLEGAYKKKKGTLLEETEHTVTFLSAGKGEATIMSKRDIMLGTMIGHDQLEPCCFKDADRWLQKERESLNDTAIMSETHSSGEQQTNSEAQNESNDSIQEIASFPPEQSTSAMTEQPIRSEKQTKTKRPAIEKLKKAIRQQRRQRKNKKKKQQTANSPNLKTINALESDEEEMMAKEKDEEQQQKKQESEEETRPTMPQERELPEPRELKEPNELPPRRQTVQEGSENRRGERRRYKTNFYGQNVMVTRIDGTQAEDQN